MPVGIQITGKQMGEEDVLALAAQIQKMRGVGLPLTEKGKGRRTNE
jgi:Asp-tRNA(Asn)/Glu-tRNA(Gln) amidotransferase A subunit family amidase